MCRTAGSASGTACQGQVLILFDILGIYPRFTPKFVRQYAMKPGEEEILKKRLEN
jgi:3-methyl-2-oxobutanoate hydroxymethyltransferase